MKKILLLLGVAMLAIAPVSAQSKKDVRLAKKEAKKAVKAAEKEGYKMLEVGDLETRIAKHLEKVYAGTAFQIVNTAEGKRSVNMAKSIARNNIINEHAESARAIVKGRVTSDMHDVNSVQAENFVAAYERLVCAELNGEVRVSYTLVRHNKKQNTYDVKLVCLIDYDAAHQRHLNAIKRAAEEQKMAQEYGTRISKWIDEGFVKQVVNQ
ncbi:MAG: hypothetical protein IKL20_00665 [Alistipes sp.]|nr:hypothetical protein [Alistipes sp.]